MKILNKIKNGLLLVVLFAAVLSACNKLDLDPTPSPAPDNGTTPTLATLLDDPNFSKLKAAVTRVGLLPALSSTSARFTVFAPTDAAITASVAAIAPGVPVDAFLASLPDETLKAIIQYHVIPQEIRASSIPGTFPNYEYPSVFNPAPDLSALFRLSTFPSVRSNGAWVNNIPITGVNIQAVNGVVHTVAAIVMPPSRYLWDEEASAPPLNVNNSIFADPNLTYLKAAIIRADSGVATGSRLVDALTNIGANLTVFAPTDDAMKAFVTGALTQAFVAKGLPPATAQVAAGTLVTVYGPKLIQNPADSVKDILPGITGLGAQIAVIVTPTFAKAIVAYHVLSSQSGTYAPPGVRVFSVNLPGTATNVKTLLMPAAPLLVADPVVNVQATFVSPFPGVSVVAAATVKGYSNTSSSNVIVGRTTSDLHFLNGVMHKIDQVLIPPPAKP